MTTKRKQIEAFLFHPGVNDSWACRQLYGNASSGNRAKFSNKKHGARGFQWTAEEIARLHEIRFNFILEISAKPKRVTITSL